MAVPYYSSLRLSVLEEAVIEWWESSMEVETTTAIAAAVVGSQSWETAKHPPFDSVMKQKRCSCFQL